MGSSLQVNTTSSVSLGPRRVLEALDGERDTVDIVERIREQCDLAGFGTDGKLEPCPQLSEKRLAAALAAMRDVIGSGYQVDEADGARRVHQIHDPFAHRPGRQFLRVDVEQAVRQVACSHEDALVETRSAQALTELLVVQKSPYLPIEQLFQALAFVVGAVDLGHGVS